MSKKEFFLERLIFGARGVLIALFTLITIGMIIGIVNLKLDTNLEKMVPLGHEYIKNMLRYKDDLGIGNNVRVAIALKQGVGKDIFDKDYLDVVKQITDQVAELPGVDKSKLKSLWTPNVRWLDVTKDGFEGGEVIPRTYDGSRQSLDEMRVNVLRSGQVGTLVADNFRSSIVDIPLLEGEFTAKGLSDQLNALRDKYSNDKYEIHINGFYKKVGDLIEGGSKIAIFFVVAILLTFFLLLWDFGDLLSSLVVIFCALIAVIWQQGTMGLLGMAGIQGFGVDPYSMLVPFLVFAIAVSHSVQVVNMIAWQFAAGDTSPEAASRHAFSSLFKAGVIGLAMEALGFLTLLLINIKVIQGLAVAASVGVALIVLTNFVLLPVLMSYFRISDRAIKKVHLKSRATGIWALISRMTETGPALAGIVAALVMLAGSFVVAQNLKIGDLDRGAPELKADSRYNIDDKFITDNYSISADVLVLMVKTQPQMCSAFETLDVIDRLQWSLESVEGVQSAKSLVTGAKRVLVGFNESNLKWSTIPTDERVLSDATSKLTDLYTPNCDLVPVFVFLNDHKAETLARVSEAVKAFKQQNHSDNVEILMASGNAGIEAATNDVISASKNRMLLSVYAVVLVLSILAFRSWRPVVCIVVPLIVTSVLCEALMTLLGIGVKVATLPVIALGVGIGVDYGIYIYARLEKYLAEGMSLKDAYTATLTSTGRAVNFTGLTLAIGVCTWVASPIKFQADMGLLLTFMFLWNMLGALVLIPAFARFLVKPKRAS